jgi:hypothetical protein
MSPSDWISLFSLIFNVIQYLVAFSTDTTLRVRAQSGYFDWHMVGDLGGTIKQHPERAAEVAEALIKLSHAHQTHIIEYSQEKLGITPRLQTPWEPKPPSSLGLPCRLWSALWPK